MSGYDDRYDRAPWLDKVDELTERKIYTVPVETEEDLERVKASIRPAVEDLAKDLHTKMQDPDYRFNEGELLNQLKQYIDKTYTQHYAKNEEDIQTFELIAQGNNLRGLHFAIGNILKYADRYGYKDGYNRADLLKVVHYGLLALWAHDKAKEKDLSEKPVFKG